MKKYISIIIFCAVAFLSLGVGVFSFNYQANLFASASAQEVEVYKDGAPENLTELQTASDGQLDHWATSLDKFDGRQYDIVTRARDQGNRNICWAFATIGAVESNILRKGIDDSASIISLDLDERVLAYARFNNDGLHDPLNLTIGDAGLAGFWNFGDKGYNAYDAMTRGNALVDQVANLTEDDMDAMNRELMQGRYYIQNYFRVSNDKESIKRAILKYGAVSFTYAAPGRQAKYFSGSTVHATNHESLIVGWDDNESSIGFTPNTPTGNGAWIVKNSWGTYGNNNTNGISCFYMSYEQYITAPYVVDVAMRENYQNIYHYDGQISPVSSTFTTEKQAAIYEAKLSSSTKQEVLSAITIFTDLSDIDVKIEIHKNLTVNPGDINDERNNPEDGPLAETTIAHLGTAGFHTLDLDNPVNLEQGEYFSIVISSEQADKKPVAVCRPDGDSVNDMTYFYRDGKWDSYKNGSNYVAKIRAITNVVDMEESSNNDLKYARVEIENRLVPYDDGVKVIPDIEVYFDEELLTQEVDYDVKFENTSLPGMATVVITGKDRFTGSRTTYFEVAKAKYVPSRISGTIKVYNDITKPKDLTIPEGWDWLGGDEQLKTGERQGPFTLIYRGPDAECYQNIYSSFYIEKIAGEKPEQTDISDANMEVLGSYVYTGQQIVPKVRITYLGVELRNHDDYELEFQNNTNAGEATVIVKGKGNYSGQSNLNFTIRKATWPKEKPKSTMLVNKSIKNSNEITLENGWSWQKPFDITSDKTQAVAVYKGTDKNNFANMKLMVTITRGSETVKKNIATISELRLERTEYVYDGQAKMPDVIAKDGETELSKGTDFNVQYQSNINAGQASVVVTGINGYTGSRTLTFNIKKADRDNFKVILEGWTYGQTAQEPRTEGQLENASVTYSYSDRIDGTFTTTKPSKAGTYWVKAVIDASRNYNAAENITQFTISKADYPPNMPRTEMTISRKAKTLQDVNLDAAGWQWETPNTKISGETLTATAVYSDKENYVNYTVQITLTKADPKDVSLLSVVLDANSFVYNGTERKPNVVAKDGGVLLVLGEDYDVAYQDNTNAGKGKVIVTFKNDYTGSKTLEFTISQAQEPTVNKIIRLDHQATKLSEIQLPDDFVWENGDLEITAGRMRAKAIYVGADAENYKTKEIYFEIISPVPQNEPETNNLIWLAIVVPVAALLIGWAVYAIIRRRKNKWWKGL